MLETIARTCYRRRRLVVVGWIVLLVVLQGLAGALGGDPATDFSLPGTESEDVTDTLEAGGFGGRGGFTGQIVVAAPDVRAEEVRIYLETLEGAVEKDAPELAVRGPFTEEGARQIAPDASVAYAEIDFGDVNMTEAFDYGQRLTDELRAVEPPPGVTLELGGEMFIGEAEFSSEAFGFLAAAVILFVAFGSLLAMGLPLLTALFGIAAGAALVGLWANVFSMPEFATATVAMISIGVGIDYALFIVTRFREELALGQEPEGAVVTAVTTSGRAVLFAGCTVVVSLLGLLLVNLASTRSLAVAMASGVLMVMLASVTLLPALLGFVGRTIDRFGIRRRTAGGAAAIQQSRWYRWSRLVQRRPWPVAIVGVVLLLLLTAPLLGMRLGFADASNRPSDNTTRKAYELLSDGFGPGHNGPLFLAVDLRGADEADRAAVVQRLEQGVAADPDVAGSSPVIPGESGIAFMQVFPATAPQEERTEDLVHRLRDDVASAAEADTGAVVYVGGSTAAAADFAEYTARRLPQFIGAVLVLSFLLLLVVFRSLLVPLKAVIMNMLSIGASYGVVVAVFQWGWLQSALGLGEPGPVEAWVPIMMFAIVFGLSMDYEVFLLSRIREEYDRTGDNATAVADGLARTARLITAAAAIMCFVFGGFILSTDRALALLGLGLTTAVLVDATLVRLLLVPATMELLGDRNWWMPSWLERVVPKLKVE